MTTLFLKYRPQNFADLVGQEAIVKTLRNALKNDKPAHAYLFVGSRGTGKTSSARIFAKGLNSFDKNSAEILENDLTAQIAEGDCVDIIEIDAASHTGVDNIRDLIEKVQFLPTYAKRKVYIIDEVHMLSKGAFNALLKTLEEPPEHAFFLLATTELHKVPDTIISRCQTFVFQRFTMDQLVGKLEEICAKENFTAENEALHMIGKQAEGGLRDAISLLEQMAAETDGNITAAATQKSLGISSTEILEQFWNGIQSKEVESGLAVLKQINANGGDFRTFGHDFLTFLREKMHADMKNKTNLGLIIQTIEAIQKALGQLKTSPIVELPLEIAVINLCQGETMAQTAPVVAPVKKSVDFSAPASQKTTPPAPTPVEPPKPETQPTPEKTAPAATAPTTPSNFSQADITKKMTEVAEKAGIPVFVKKSFLTSSPQILGDTINFSVTSSFHHEQLDKSEIKSKIGKTLSDIFGKTLTVEFSRGLQSPKPSPSPASTSSSSGIATADDFLTF